MNSELISYDEALRQTLDHLSPLDGERVDLSSTIGRVATEDVFALVDSPSVDVSLKDGYAIQSADITCATLENPIRLQLIGVAAAGGHWDGEVRRGTAVRILSGARIPKGADAVVSEEFTRRDSNGIIVMAQAEPERNILSKGSDVAIGQRLATAGDMLQPAQVGLLAAGGHTALLVRRQPRVAIIATGDEVIAPGFPLKEGKLYASNMVTLAAWCSHYGMQVSTYVVQDNALDIRERLAENIKDHDVLITSGGAWKGDRDLVVSQLNQLGWTKVYHRIKIGPGKAVGFGLLQGKPVFCLPGGPSSNYMAFLQLALPGLMKLSGYKEPGLPTLVAQLTEDVHGLIDWTQFIQGVFEWQKDTLLFHPLKMASRLQMMAQAEGLLMIPEGISHIPAGELVQVQALVWPTLRYNLFQGQYY
jgi:molybdopterin molybdotransferase